MKPEGSKWDGVAIKEMNREFFVGDVVKDYRKGLIGLVTAEPCAAAKTVLLEAVSGMSWRCLKRDTYHMAGRLPPRILRSDNMNRVELYPSDVRLNDFMIIDRVPRRVLNIMGGTRVPAMRRTLVLEGVERPVNVQSPRAYFRLDTLS
ncbi:hypothetical protein GCM10010331_44930 [Streptomyces xanthochromogenes]|nr:hypothetical protein GCM10010331_44930 [Streptomyces xanthochromogenes]